MRYKEKCLRARRTAATPASGLVIMITMAWPNVVSPHKILSPALKFRVEEMYNDSHDENKAKGGFKAAAAQITLLSREKKTSII